MNRAPTWLSMFVGASFMAPWPPQLKIAWVCGFPYTHGFESR
jgi:hypothetical protein